MAKKQASGLYRTKVKIGVDPEGKSIYKYISGKTKKELEAARQQVIAYYIDGRAVGPGELFGNYCLRWYAAKIDPMRSDSTRASYRLTINKHVLPVFGERNLRAITALELQEWINGFAGMSDTTITLLMTIMRKLFTSALADRLIDVNPATGLAKPRVSAAEERRALTPEETAALLPLMDQTRDGQYLACLYYLGLRPGEALGLQWGDFDWINDTVHIQRDIDYAAKGAVGSLKTNAADRYVPVPEDLRNLLLPSRGFPDAFLFQGVKSGKPLSKTSAYTLWINLMVRAGLAEKLDEPKNANDVRRCYRPTITPYYLRHNYITKCWRAGMDPLVVQRIVGHKDYRTTANIYTHLNNEHLAKARSDISSVFSDEKEVAKKLHKPTPAIRAK